MKQAQKRNNQFILLLDDENAQKLKQLAEANDHAPSKQAYLLIKKALAGVYLKDDNGNDILKIGGDSEQE